MTAAAQCHMTTRAQKLSMWDTPGVRSRVHMRPGGNAVEKPLKATAIWVPPAVGVTKESIPYVVDIQSPFRED